MTNKLISALLILLIPNWTFLVLNVITETSRPLLNVDYIVPVMLVLLDNKLCKAIGFITLVFAVISDLAMFVFQMFPFMDIEGALYLSPFLLNGPAHYLAFIIAIVKELINRHTAIRNKRTRYQRNLAATLYVFV